MNIAGIIWHKDVLSKLGWKHRIIVEEVEQVLANRPKFKRQERGNVKGEDLYTAYGRTDAGRYLTVFFICKRSREALIVTARDMDRKERRRYAKK